ncbi:MAG: hypothetical protein ABFD69_10255 [Candidatus Sumerlaeia bacterium]
MKKSLFAALFAIGMMAAPSIAQAHVYDRDDSDYPLRYVAYVVHPVGMLAEYAVLRPIHWVVSQPVVAPIVGHYPNRCEEKDTYFEFY